jgi:hypothetical protein
MGGLPIELEIPALSLCAHRRVLRLRHISVAIAITRVETKLAKCAVESCLALTCKRVDPINADAALRAAAINILHLALIDVDIARRFA